MMILFHVVENIGMTIGLLPLTGFHYHLYLKGVKTAWKYDGDWPHYVHALPLQSTIFEDEDAAFGAKHQIQPCYVYVRRMKMIVYVHPTCTTWKKALKWF